VQHKDHGNVNRRPGKIEDRMDAHAGNELAEGVEIAQQLAARATETCGAVNDRSHDAGGDRLVEANAGSGQHTGANGIQPGQRQERHQQRYQC